MSFLNCLRVQIVPNHYEEERINNIVEYCLKYGFKNVMLFINSEEYNVGHMTIEEARPWVETIKKAKKVFQDNGITVSLNPWIEIGQIDRNRPLKENQNFTTMVDFDGNKSEMSVCPLCENWRSYFAEFYSYLLKEIQPDTVWVEDDFRLHNHQPLKYGGCFCDIHLKKINEVLGEKYTRKQIKDLLFRGDKKVREAWLDINKETMNDTALFIGELVKESCDAKVGLMSSVHINHAMEGRDWQFIHEALSQGGTMIDRLHLPCYDEILPKTYFYNFNLISYVCRGFLPNDCEVYPELENGAFSTFIKDSRFLQFQLESAIPLCIKGMTYDIYDFVGNGVVPTFGYGEVINDIKPYLDKVVSLDLKFDQTRGIICPIDEKSVYNREKVKDFVDLYPDEHNFYAYLASLGLNIKVSKEKEFVKQIVALSNGSVFNFSEEQLVDLFKSNFVVLEGGAVINLIDRGFGYLINADGYNLEDDNGKNSYEQVNDDIVINGIKGYRASALSRAGQYVNIRYNSYVNCLTTVYDYNDNCVGNGIVSNDNFYIIPYIIKGISFNVGLSFDNNVILEQFNDLRTNLLKDAIVKNSKQIISTGYSGVYCYLYDQSIRKVVLLVNSTLNDFNGEILLKGITINDACRVNRKDDGLEKVEFININNDAKIKVNIEHITTCCLIIE